MPLKLLQNAYRLPLNATVALSPDQCEILYGDRSAKPAYDYAPVNEDWNSIDSEAYENQIDAICHKLLALVNDPELYFNEEEKADPNNKKLLDKIENARSEYPYIIEALRKNIQFHKYENPDNGYLRQAGKPIFFEELKSALEVIILHIDTKLKKIKTREYELTDKIDALSRVHGAVMDASVCEEGAHSKLLSMKSEILGDRGVKPLVAQKLNACFERLGEWHNSYRNVYSGNMIHTPDFFKNLAKKMGLFPEDMPYTEFKLVPVIMDDYEEGEDGTKKFHLRNQGYNALNLTDADLSDFKRKLDILFNPSTIVDSLADHLASEISTAYANYRSRNEQDTNDLKESTALLASNLNDLMGEFGTVHVLGFFDYQEVRYKDELISVDALDSKMAEEGFDERDLKITYFPKSDIAISYWCHVFAMRALHREDLVSGVEQIQVIPLPAPRHEIHRKTASDMNMEWYEDKDGNPLSLAWFLEQEDDQQAYRCVIGCSDYPLLQTLTEDFKRPEEFPLLLAECVDRRERLRVFYNLIQVVKENPIFSFRSIQDLEAVFVGMQNESPDDLPRLLEALERVPRSKMQAFFREGLLDPRLRMTTLSVLKKIDSIKEEDSSNKLQSSNIYNSRELLDGLFKLTPEEAKELVPPSWFGDGPGLLPLGFFAMKDFTSIFDLRPDWKTASRLAALFKLYPPMIGRYLTSVPEGSNKTAILWCSTVLRLNKENQSEVAVNELIELSLSPIRSLIVDFSSLLAYSEMLRGPARQNFVRVAPEADLDINTFISMFMSKSNPLHFSHHSFLVYLSDYSPDYDFNPGCEFIIGYIRFSLSNPRYEAGTSLGVRLTKVVNKVLELCNNDEDNRYLYPLIAQMPVIINDKDFTQLFKKAITAFSPKIVSIKLCDALLPSMEEGVEKESLLARRAEMKLKFNLAQCALPSDEREPLCIESNDDLLNLRNSQGHKAIDLTQEDVAVFFAHSSTVEDLAWIRLMVGVNDFSRVCLLDPVYAQRIQEIISASLMNRETRTDALIFIHDAKGLNGKAKEFLTPEFIDTLNTLENKVEAREMTPSGLTGDPSIDANYPDLVNYSSIHQICVTSTEGSQVQLALLFGLNPNMIKRYLTEVPEDEQFYAISTVFDYKHLWVDRPDLCEYMVEQLKIHLNSLGRLKVLTYSLSPDTDPPFSFMDLVNYAVDNHPEGFSLQALSNPELELFNFDLLRILFCKVQNSVPGMSLDNMSKPVDDLIVDTLFRERSAYRIHNYLVVFELPDPIFVKLILMYPDWILTYATRLESVLMGWLEKYSANPDDPALTTHYLEVFSEPKFFELFMTKDRAEKIFMRIVNLLLTDEGLKVSHPLCKDFIVSLARNWRSVDPGFFNNVVFIFNNRRQCETENDSRRLINFYLPIFAEPFPPTISGEKYGYIEGLVGFITRDNFEDVLFNLHPSHWRSVIVEIGHMNPELQIDFSFIENLADSQAKVSKIYNSYRQGQSFSEKLELSLRGSVSTDPDFINKLKDYCENHVISEKELPAIKKLFAHHIAELYQQGKLGVIFGGEGDPVDKAIRTNM